MQTIKDGLVSTLRRKMHVFVYIVGLCVAELLSDEYRLALMIPQFASLMPPIVLV